MNSTIIPRATCTTRKRILSFITTPTGKGEKHPEIDAFEDRGCDITSARKISVAAQTKRVNQALMSAAA
jgi:hypothetical protein